MIMLWTNHTTETYLKINLYRNVFTCDRFNDAIDLNSHFSIEYRTRSMWTLCKCNFFNWYWLIRTIMFFSTFMFWFCVIYCLKFTTHKELNRVKNIFKNCCLIWSSVKYCDEMKIENRKFFRNQIRCIQCDRDYWRLFRLTVLQ